LVDFTKEGGFQQVNISKHVGFVGAACSIEGPSNAPLAPVSRLVIVRCVAARSLRDLVFQWWIFGARLIKQRPVP
jgi:hypothetical protein